jgi:hypothetical protein
MYNPDTEVLFPLRVVPLLRAIHGDEWQGLVDHIQSKDSLPHERYAFVLMMVRMCGCVGCNADSFRAMRGCSQCARQSVRRFRGGDREILEQYKLMQKEIGTYLQKNAAEGNNTNQKAQE